MAEYKWSKWVDFMKGQAHNKYATDVTQTNPDNESQWYIMFGKNGAVYAQSEDFPCVFDEPELNKMHSAAGGEETDIWVNPPNGFTMINTVDCDDGIVVLQGRNKEDATNVIFVASGEVSIIAVVYLANNNQGLTSSAIDAFAKAVAKVKENGGF